jgi:hypothetical protein
MKSNLYNRKFASKILTRKVLGLIATVVIITIIFSSVSAQSSVIVDEDIKSHFSLNIAYSYVGQGPSNASYISETGAIMSPISLNPSSTILNISRLSEAKTASADALVELYSIEVTADNGLTESFCYFIGTNNKPSFSNAELSALLAHVDDFTIGEKYYVVAGDFPFNMTEKSSFVSTPIGSYGCYSTGYSTDGLWNLGTPKTISVSTQRIGSLEINDGSVSVHKETNDNEKTSIQLYNQQTGFLFNNLIDNSKLEQVNIFYPLDD